MMVADLQNCFSVITISSVKLTHGVVIFTANLDYENQPGALNEHFVTALPVEALSNVLEYLFAQQNLCPIGARHHLGCRSAQEKTGHRR